MPIGDAYRAQADLLIRCLPAVAQVREFALKGGTAINLFHHNMPRLSVDIDLTFLPISDRDTALAEIHAGLATIQEQVHRSIPQVQIHSTGNNAPKLLVATDRARIKVEPSAIIRGSLFPPVESDLCQAAQDEYELFVRAQRLATGDLYGGKLCAALDRQHPRDYSTSSSSRTLAGLQPISDKRSSSISLDTAAPWQSCWPRSGSRLRTCTLITSPA